MEPCNVLGPLILVGLLLCLAGCMEPAPASAPAAVPPLPPETPSPVSTTPEPSPAAPLPTVKATATPTEPCPSSMCPEGVNCYCCGTTTCPGNWGCCHTETGDICFDPEHYRCTDKTGSTSGGYQSCSGPDATCPTGLRCCYGRCVDVLWDQSNCGTCGRVCTQGSWCNRGKCQSYV